MRLRGIVVPTVTPYEEDGKTVDRDAIASLVDFLVKMGVDAVFVNGTTGEGPLLSTDERKQSAEAVLAAAQRRIPVAVHIGAPTTEESIDLACHARAAGADAVACTTPYFYKYGEAELEKHFLEVASSVPDLDFYLYTIPARTQNEISTHLAQRLLGTFNIVGIKDSTGDIAQLFSYLQLEGAEVICGSDPLAISALQIGASGVVSGPANVFPEPYVAMWNAWQDENKQEAMYWYQVILNISQAVSFGANLGILKYFLRLRLGLYDAVRRPLSVPTMEETATAAVTVYDLLRETPLPDQAYAWLG